MADCPAPLPRPSAVCERIAHRGMPRRVTENTLPGFLLALERGAEGVELDVHVSGDGVVVVHHDEVLAGAPITSLTWEELARRELAGGGRIPRLDQVFDSIGDRATVYVELKGRDIEDAVLAAARAHGHRFALHSFDHQAIERVAEKAPDVARGILLDRATRRPIEALRAAVARFRPRDVWPHHSLVDRRFVAAAHEAGTRVIVWTVNSTAMAATLLHDGVDGICTDDVELLAQLPSVD